VSPFDDALEWVGEHGAGTERRTLSSRPARSAAPEPTPASAVFRVSAHRNELSTRDEWERRIQEIHPSALRDNPFADVLLRHLPVQPGWSALEIGTIPGRFLLFLHKAFGYRISGLDYARDWTLFDGVIREGKVAEVEKIVVDFLTFTTSRTFHVVASFGFIEHFRDVSDVIRRHTRLVSPGGYLVLSVPNFTRFQYIYHWLVDRANLRIHNTRAMSKPLIERLVKRDGFHLCYSGHIGRLEVWREDQPLASWQRAIDRATRFVVARLAPHLPESAWYSPYYLLIARRESLQ